MPSRRRSTIRRRVPRRCSAWIPARTATTSFLPSRLEPLKRQSLVIEAMRHVRSGVRLVLVGRGPDEPALRDQVGGRVSDRCRSRSASRDERLHELYLGALGVYYGPYDEDYGYVTLEGFAAHRPVVTHDRRRRAARVRHRRRHRARGRARAGRSRRRSTGSAADRDAGRADGRGRQRGRPRPRADAGPRSSRGCWTDAMAPRAKDLARARVKRYRQRRVWDARCIRGSGSSRRCRRRRPASPRTPRRCSTACGGSASSSGAGWTSCGRSSRSTKGSCPGTGWGSTQLGNNVEFHRDIYRFACQAPGLDRAARPGAGRLRAGLKATGDPLGFVAEREAARLRAAPARRRTSLRNEPLREPWCAPRRRAARAA